MQLYLKIHEYDGREFTAVCDADGNILTGIKHVTLSDDCDEHSNEVTVRLINIPWLETPQNSAED